MRITSGSIPFHKRFFKAECFDCRPIPGDAPVQNVVLGASLHCADSLGRIRIRDSWAHEAVAAGFIFHFFVGRDSTLCPEEAIQAEAASAGDIVILNDLLEGTDTISAARKQLAIIKYVSDHQNVDALVWVDAATVFIDARRLAARLHNISGDLISPGGVLGAHVAHLSYPSSVPPGVPSTAAAWVMSRPALVLIGAAVGRPDGLDAAVSSLGDSADFSALVAWLRRISPHVQIVPEPGIAICPEAACFAAPRGGDPVWAVRLLPQTSVQTHGNAGSLRRQQQDSRETQPDDNPLKGRDSVATPTALFPDDAAQWATFSEKMRTGQPILPPGSRCCVPEPSSQGVVE